MPLPSNILTTLQTDYPTFEFILNDTTAWDPDTKTIYYNPSEQFAEENILHEIAHAELNHHQYQTGIELLRQESDAWQRAAALLAPRYGMAIAASVVDTALDTYRDWLHARSSCPRCTMLGIEHSLSRYRCITCAHEWRVNDGRSIGLRRYSIA